VPSLAALAIAGGFGAIASAIVGFIALRRSTGIYFAMLTMALGEVLHISISYVNVLGRDDGLAAVPRPVLGLGFASIDLRQGDRYYWFLFFFVLLTAAILQILVRGRIGRALRAVRDDPERFAFLGADIQAYRRSSSPAPSPPWPGPYRCPGRRLSRRRPPAGFILPRPC
jgi:branched-chain amino acid transport system permease protein